MPESPSTNPATSAGPDSTSTSAELDRGVLALIAAAEDSSEPTNARPRGVTTMTRTSPPTPETSTTGEAALAAVESVDELLSEVAADLLSNEPAGQSSPSTGAPNPTGPASGGANDIATAPPAPSAPSAAPSAAMTKPSEAAGTAAATSPPTGARSKLADEVMRDVGREIESPKVVVAPTPGSAPKPNAGVDPKPSAGVDPQAARTGAIDQLDAVLADAAEEVLAGSSAAANTAAANAASGAVEAPTAEGAKTGSPAPAAAPTPSGAATSASAPKGDGSSTSTGDAVASDAPSAAAPKPNVKRFVLSEALAAALAPLTKLTSSLSPTARQTVSWLAVYSALLAAGVWGFLLLRGPAAPAQPTSEPTPFLKPGEHAPTPKHKEGGDGDGNGDSHGTGHAAEAVHGAPKKATAKKADSHGSSGSDSHGAAKKTSSKSAKADSHGAPAKKTAANKSGKKKADAGHGGGHH